jgi:quercetin dioxygenase-like cupin family protein
VLDGELRVFAGEEEHTAGPGTVAVLPRRLRHAVVAIASPSGLML